MYLRSDLLRNCMKCNLAVVVTSKCQRYRTLNLFQLVQKLTVLFNFETNLVSLLFVDNLSLFFPFDCFSKQKYVNIGFVPLFQLLMQLKREFSGSVQKILKLNRLA